MPSRNQNMGDAFAITFYTYFISFGVNLLGIEVLKEKKKEKYFELGVSFVFKSGKVRFIRQPRKVSANGHKRYVPTGLTT